MGHAEMAAEKLTGDELCFKDEQRLCDPHELAARLNVPVSWVYSQTRARKIPFVKAGHYCRFNFSEVVAHLRKSIGGDKG